MAMTPQTVLAMCRERDIKAVDLRFMDFPGLWQHTSVPISELTPDSFEHGFCRPHREQSRLLPE